MANRAADGRGCANAVIGLAIFAAIIIGFWICAGYGYFS